MSIFEFSGLAAVPGASRGGTDETPGHRRRGVVLGRGAAGATGGRPARFDGLLPLEIGYAFVPGSRNQVRVRGDRAAVLERWHRDGGVELMAAGRPLRLEPDLDGAGVRVVDPVTRLPLAVFRPRSRGGLVDLADGSTLRWLRPRRRAAGYVFERGFVGWRNANVVRFAHDGVAIVLVDPSDLTRHRPPVARPDFGAATVADPRRGWVPEVAVLVPLGWFLLLLEDESVPPAPAYPDLDPSGWRAAPAG
ncbi:hypothetical protein [Parafrankia discariae]|uniref:hypothetical protein n=1 Tax=Parafrankia discariae TaxID=365528 RepID=UPI0005582DB2|nr:hypothetical protein [Parafrankia discariae]